jgi:hypothetical protein
VFGKIKIDFNKNSEEVKSILESTHITIKMNSRYGPGMESGTKWLGLDDLSNFKFVPTIFGPMRPWWGKCSLFDSEVEGKSALKMTIWMPKVFLFMLGLMICGFLYFEIIMIAENYREPWIFAGVLVPAFFFGLMIFIWRLMFQYSANKIKKEIIRSLRENRKTKHAKSSEARTN